MSVCVSHWCPSGVVGVLGGRLLVVSDTMHLHLCDLQRVVAPPPVIPEYPLQTGPQVVDTIQVGVCTGVIPPGPCASLCTVCTTGAIIVLIPGREWVVIAVSKRVPSSSTSTVA